MHATDDVQSPTLSPFWDRTLELGLRGVGAALFPIVPYLTLTYAFPVSASFLRPYAIHMLVVSVLFGVTAAVYWTQTEEHRESARLHRLLQTIICYFLAYIFVTYGFAKFYRTQLYEPFLIWQDTPVRELSGFELTWTFFGSSYPYAIFIGASQILCAVLLVFRKTQLLGAVLLLPIIGNIAFVNFAYDIPVKLNSVIFLMMTGYLVLSEFKRLKAFFWDRQPVQGRRDRGSTPKHWTTARVVKATCVLAIVGAIFWRFEAETVDWSFVERPVFGIWKVDAFELKRQAQTEPEASSKDWTKVIFEAQGGGTRALIKRGDRVNRATYTVDSTEKMLKIRGGQRLFTGRYELVNERYMVLSGTYGADSVRAELHRVD